MENAERRRPPRGNMAGRVAVAIADRLVQRSLIVLDANGGQLTAAGQAFFDEMGVDLCRTPGRRMFCRPCLDWSERRPHLAGAVGASVLRYALDHGWVERVRDNRALTVPSSGVAGLAAAFGVEAAPRGTENDGSSL